MSRWKNLTCEGRGELNRLFHSSAKMLNADASCDPSEYSRGGVMVEYQQGVLWYDASGWRKRIMWFW